MKKNYVISDFYVSLKLGIWKSGDVVEWGRVSSVMLIKNDSSSNYMQQANHLTNSEKLPFLKKSVSYYLQQSFAKFYPTIGVYILDSYLISKKKDRERTLKTYIVVISTGRFGLTNKEYTYVLKVSNYAEIFNFASVMNSGVKKRKRKSYFRKRFGTHKTDFIPIHAKEL